MRYRIRPLVFILLFTIYFDFIEARETPEDSLVFKINLSQKQTNGTIKELGSQVFIAKGNSTKEPAILGNGVYDIVFSADTNTFSETWRPSAGSFIEEFKGENIITRRWIKNLDLAKGTNLTYYKLLEKRITARLIEGTIEKGLIKLNFNPEEVKREVQVLESGTELDGKFACFTNDEVGKKYIKGWRRRTPTPMHRSRKAYNSAEIFNADVLICVYDGRKNLEDAYPTHIGLIRKGLPDHSFEAFLCIIKRKKGCNAAKKNILRIQKKLKA